jgi:hypothetical protein
MRRDYENEEYEPEMPPVEACAHILRYLWEVGPVLAGGMAPAPITQQEIRSWQENSGVRLQPWEARWMRELSTVYLNELHKAEAPNRPPPWVSEGTARENLTRAAQSMRRAFAEMADL